MSSKHPVGGLRVDVPAREPDPVLLHQLSELSAASVRAPRRAYPKVLAAVASVAVLGATTWLAGAVPGTDSPLSPSHHRHEHGHTVPSSSVNPSPSARAGAPGVESAATPQPSALPTPAGTPEGGPTAAASGSAPEHGLGRLGHDHGVLANRGASSRDHAREHTGHHAGKPTADHTHGQGHTDRSGSGAGSPARSAPDGAGQSQSRSHAEVRRFPVRTPQVAPSPPPGQGPAAR